MNKQILKMNEETLQGLLHMRKRNFSISPKKGKGSYKRRGKYPSKYY